MQPPRLTFVIDDFQLFEKIGSGKFGKVYKAIEKRSNQTCALKMVKKELLTQYDFFGQMRKELEIQWRLGQGHPNIAKTHCYFYDAENVYSVLEYAPHGNLYQKLRRQGRFEEPVARSIIQQIVSALYFCQ